MGRLLYGGAWISGRGTRQTKEVSGNVAVGSIISQAVGSGSQVKASVAEFLWRLLRLLASQAGRVNGQYLTTWTM
jgi:hypothetical protein